MTRAVIHDPDPPHPPMPSPPAPPPKTVPQVALGDHLRDPRPLYDLLAASGRPAAYAADYRLWLLHRHADVKAALSDTARWSNTATLTPVYQPCDAAMAVLTQLDVPATTAAADDPGHRRTRAALRTVFPNTAARVRDRWGTLVDWRVDQATTMLAARRWRTADLTADYATLIPLWTICDLLGVPSSDIDQIQAWADGQIALLWGRPDDREQVRLARGLLDFWRYTQRLVAARAEQDPFGDDVTARLLRYRAGDDHILTLDEVASIVFNLLVAGHETTAGLIAHCLHRALATPGVWDTLGADPTLIPAFVENTLRCAPPIDGWLRLARTDVNLGDGVVVPAGARALLLIGAANQDEAGELLSFGHGPHYCIGAALARLEAETALRQMAVRLPRLRLRPGWTPTYRPNLAFRALEALPAALL